VSEICNFIIIQKLDVTCHYIILFSDSVLDCVIVQKLYVT